MLYARKPRVGNGNSFFFPFDFLFKLHHNVVEICLTGTSFLEEKKRPTTPKYDGSIFLSALMVL